MRARFATLLGAVAVAIAAGSARAGEQSIEVGGVRVTVSSSWPSALNRGWQPALVRVENPTGDERGVKLTFSCSPGPGVDIVTRGLRVPAGGSESFELALPVRPQLQNSYSLTVEAGDRGYAGAIGAEQGCPPNERVVLAASRAGPSTVAVAGWATELSKESEPRVPADVLTGRGVRFGSGRVVVTPVGGPAAAAATPENVHVTGIAFENLSALPEAYTSLHALVLDVGDGTPPTRGVLDAITAWVRTGGVLAVAGRGAREFLAKEPALAAWTEPRFRVRGSDDAATYACGLGLLLVMDGEKLLADPVQVADLNAAIEARAPLDTLAPHSAFELAIPGIAVPFRSLTLLLVLFAILVGPVNLILVRRSKRPALLLLTIPAIALVFSVGLVAYGAVAQGLDVKASSSSVGVLDQRSHHGSAHERRTVFAGLAAGPGIRPGPGAVVERVGEEALDWSNRREYRTNSDAGLTLSGSWLPVRTPTRFSVSVDRAARGRVDVERTADGWKLTNGLEATVSQLLFRDAEGELHAFAGPVVPGRSLVAAAADADPDVVASFRSQRVLAAPVADGDFLPRGAWIARVDASPLLDPCGIEYDELAHDHVVLGVLDAAEKR